MITTYSLEYTPTGLALAIQVDNESILDALYEIKQYVDQLIFDERFSINQKSILGDNLATIAEDTDGSGMYGDNRFALTDEDLKNESNLNGLENQTFEGD